MTNPPSRFLGISRKVWLAAIIAGSMFLQRCDLQIESDGITFKLQPLPLWVLGLGTTTIIGVLSLEQKDVAEIVDDFAHSAINKFLGDTYDGRSDD